MLAGNIISQLFLSVFFYSFFLYILHKQFDFMYITCTGPHYAIQTAPINLDASPDSIKQKLTHTQTHSCASMRYICTYVYVCTYNDSLTQQLASHIDLSPRPAQWELLA